MANLGEEVDRVIILPPLSPGNQKGETMKPHSQIILLLLGLTAVCGIVSSRMAERVAIHAINTAGDSRAEPDGVMATIERSQANRQNGRGSGFTLMLIAFSLMAFIAVGTPFLLAATGGLKEARTWLKRRRMGARPLRPTAPTITAVPRLPTLPEWTEDNP
jgi:hypothetical protein